jgi:hypothetical protein
MGMSELYDIEIVIRKMMLSSHPGYAAQMQQQSMLPPNQSTIDPAVLFF